MNLCAVRDPAVCEFLLGNVLLPALVLEACHRLRTVFGQDTSLRLRLSEDPEEANQYLFLFICGVKNLDEALTALDRFDREWFLSVPAPLKQRFGVTL